MLYDAASHRCHSLILMTTVGAHGNIIYDTHVERCELSTEQVLRSNDVAAGKPH